jgi:hypothetical protein
MAIPPRVDARCRYDTFSQTTATLKKQARTADLLDLVRSWLCHGLQLVSSVPVTVMMVVVIVIVMMMTVIMVMVPPMLLMMA